MPKRRRISAVIAARRKPEKIINIYGSATSGSQQNQLLLAPNVGSSTVVRNVITGSIANYNGGDVAVAIYRVEVNGATPALSITTNTTAPNDDNCIFYGRWTITNGVIPLNIDLKGKRRLRLGDSVYVYVLGGSNACYVSMAITTIYLLP